MDPGAAGAYEELEYPGYAYAFTHPARLEAIGRLFGLAPGAAAGCRVVEVGCGDGGNALAIAQSLPGAHVVGIDLSPAAIARGQTLVREAALDNIELLVGDLAEPGLLGRWAPIDYVIAHGVYSWIPPAARGALLDACKEHLAPQGIALISYNAYPGSYLRDMARDVLEFHLRGIAGARSRLAHAHRLMEAIVEAERPDPYATLLREHLQRMLSSGDALLLYDELAAVSTPFFFHEFIEHAGAHGLQFLAEAELSDSEMTDLPDGVATLLAELPQDIVTREQYFDFFTNRMFRRTLLVRDELPLQHALDDSALEQLALASPARPTAEGFLTPQGTVLSSPNPLVTAALEELCERWPADLPFGELVVLVQERLGVRASGEALAALREALVRAHLAGAVQLHGCPLPAAPGSPARPQAARLAQAQCSSGRTVLTTLRGENVELEDEALRRLLCLMDDVRDREALAQATGTSPEWVLGAVARLAADGLIWPEASPAQPA